MNVSVCPGALVEPAAVAYQGLFVEGGGVPEGAAVVVYGAGPIGLTAIALARAAGAGKVIAFQRSEPRRRLAATMGADVALNPTELRASGTRVAATRHRQGKRSCGSMGVVARHDQNDAGSDF